METKNNFLKQAEHQTKELLLKIDKLESKTQITKDETIKKLDNQLYELRKKRAELNDKLAELKKAPEDNWEYARNEFEEIIKEPFLERMKYHIVDLEDKMSDLALWTDEKWDTFYQKAQEKISGFNDKIKDLEKKASGVSERTKKNLKKEIENIKERKEQLQQNLNELSNTSGEAWKDLKKGFVEAGTSLKDAVRNAYGHLSSK